MKKQKPSLTSLKELLRQSAFDPRASGPMAVVTEIATSNPRYSEDKAKELIAQAQAVLEAKVSPDTAKANLETYQLLMTDAISLLVLARALRQ